MAEYLTFVASHFLSFAPQCQTDLSALKANPWHVKASECCSEAVNDLSRDFLSIHCIIVAHGTAASKVAGVNN
ncbi:hypothetical protein J6590_089591 [Homalodisca vitripennis]|nr:hypothetical protein J6590_089591 [Homalodisca vitripennis]